MQLSQKAVSEPSKTSEPRESRTKVARNRGPLSGTRATIALAAAIVLALVAASCASAKPTIVPPDFSRGPRAEAWTKLAEYVGDYLLRKKVQGGCAISVADAEGELWSAGFGMADVAAGRPFTPDTISGIGSVSKLVTATAIMRLVEAGKVELDAPVAAYLPELRPKTRFPGARPITVRDIMTHHSGLPSDYSRDLLVDARPSDYPESFLKDAGYASSMYLANPPGKVFAYSNLAVGILGMIVERSSGKTFEDFCRGEIFGPLEMRDSSFVLPEGFERDPRYAKGFEKGKAVTIPYIRDLPAGGLNSTARDLAKFAASYLAAYKGGAGILSPSTVASMFAAQNEGNEADLGFRIGLNFMILPFPGPDELCVGHAGGLPSFYALFLLLPERGIAISLLANTASVSLEALAEQAARAAVAATGEKPFSPEPEPSPPIAFPAETIDALAGNYCSEIFGLMRLAREGDALVVFIGGEKLRGRWRADGIVSLEMRRRGRWVSVNNLRIRPRKLGPSYALELLMGTTNPLLRADRIEASPVSAAWRSRFGKYEIDDRAEGGGSSAYALRAFEIGIDEGTGLFVERRGQTAFPLRVVSDTECVLEGQSRGSGETLEAVGDALVFSGIRYLRSK